MKDEEASIIKTLLICLMVFGIIFAISSCSARTTEAIQRTAQSKTDLQRCMGSCQGIWEKDQGCVDKCFDIEKMKYLQD